MKVVNFVLAIAFAVIVTTHASAQVPVQVTPAKVGVVNSAAFSNPTGGITRFVNAIKTLDAEFLVRRNDITASVARFEELQKVPAGMTGPQLDTRREQAQTL